MTNRGGPLDPNECETHYVMPGTTRTLCAEPITGSWELVGEHATLYATCSQCRTRRCWLGRKGKLEPDADLTTVLEPWPRGLRKHVSGDDDPLRGRLHRPESLQLCLICGELRGPYGFDNLCVCDRQAWDRDPLPRYGDLLCNVHLCKSCLSTMMVGGTRWSPYHCPECMPAVQLWRSLAGRSLVPIGPHSIMNGVAWRAENGEPISAAQATAFGDQLNALFATQRNLHELAAERAVRAARELGFDGHTVGASDFIGARRSAGATAESGFVELVASFSEIDTRELAEHIWAQSAPNRR